MNSAISANPVKMYHISMTSFFDSIEDFELVKAPKSRLMRMGMRAVAQGVITQMEYNMAVGHVARLRHLIRRAYIFGVFKTKFIRLNTDVWNCIGEFFDFNPLYYTYYLKYEFLGMKWGLNDCIVNQMLAPYNRRLWHKTYKDEVTSMDFVHMHQHGEEKELPDEVEAQIVEIVCDLHRVAYHESYAGLQNKYLRQLHLEKHGVAYHPDVPVPSEKDPMWWVVPNDFQSHQWFYKNKLYYRDFEGRVFTKNSKDVYTQIGVFDRYNYDIDTTRMEPYWEDIPFEHARVLESDSEEDE